MKCSLLLMLTATLIGYNKQRNNTNNAQKVLIFASRKIEATDLRVNGASHIKVKLLVQRQ